jgi:predicted amidohydrolase YtcJ
MYSGMEKPIHRARRRLLRQHHAFRSLLDSGAVVANGSDAPVEELDPLAGIAARVLRTIDERPAWRPEEALTVEQALHATCVATMVGGRWVHNPPPWD